MVDGLEGEYGNFIVATKALIQDKANNFWGEFRAFHDELFNPRSFVQDELQTICAEVDGLLELGYA